jgi:hypothetical protein
MAIQQGECMQRFIALAAAAAFVLSTATGVFAQAKPDFSGKWTMDPASAPAAPAGGGGGGRGGGGRGGGAGFGPEFTAKQDANTLTITRSQGGQDVTATYKLDGSESKNTVAGRGGQQEQVSKAMWMGNKLMITTTLNFGGNTVEQSRTLSLEGGDLVVEQTQPGRDGGAPQTQKVVYKKG